MKSPLIAALLAAAALPALAFAASPADKPASARFDPDANKDGYLNRAEAQAIADRRFAFLDANKDGKLMPDERPARGKFAHADGRGPKGPPMGAPPQGAPGAPPQSAPGALPQIAPGAPSQGAAGAPAQGPDGQTAPTGRWGMAGRGMGGPGMHGPGWGGPGWGGRGMAGQGMAGPGRGGPGPHGPGMGLGPHVFAEYDANKDGALSLREFRAHALRQFEARDGNRDGKVKVPDRGPPRGKGDRPWGPPPAAPAPKG